MEKNRILELSDLSRPELDAYARLNEVQLRRMYEPAHGIFVAESANVILRALDAGYEPVSCLVSREEMEGQAVPILEQLEKFDTEIPIYTAPMQVLKELTGFPLTRGVLCAMRRRTLPEVATLLEGARRVTVLEDVMNPTNLGAIFRSAAALGMDSVLLTPGCTDPLYRRCTRVSMGTVFQVPWTYFDQKTAPWPQGGIGLLKEYGFSVVAMALRETTISIEDPSLRSREKIALLLGSEGPGLKEETLECCDDTVCIPMMHGVDSLNVAAASAVAFWELGTKSAREI